MPPIADFRLSRFKATAIEKCGMYIGHRTYWKLYAIENLIRVMIHSVLSVQISTAWWSVAVDETIRHDAEGRQKVYQKKSRGGSVASHGIYYVDLRDLNEILRANANLFDPVIPELDGFLIGIEELRLPRNIIAHMNFPSETELKRIDTFYNDCQKLAFKVGDRVALRIP